MLLLCRKYILMGARNTFWGCVWWGLDGGLGPSRQGWPHDGRSGASSTGAVGAHLELPTRLNTQNIFGKSGLGFWFKWATRATSVHSSVNQMWEGHSGIFHLFFVPSLTHRLKILLASRNCWCSDRFYNEKYANNKYKQMVGHYPFVGWSPFLSCWEFFSRFTELLWHLEMYEPNMRWNIARGPPRIKRARHLLEIWGDVSK